MRIELQFIQHRRRKPVVAAPEIHRTHRNHDRHALSRKDHADRNAATTAAFRDGAACVGRRRTIPCNSISITAPSSAVSLCLHASLRSFVFYYHRDKPARPLKCSPERFFPSSLPTFSSFPSSLHLPLPFPHSPSFSLFSTFL